MNTINITSARANLYRLVDDVNKGCNPIILTNNKGSNAVLISESTWRDIEETIYINSIPGLTESILDAKKEDKTKGKKYIKGEMW